MQVKFQNFLDSGMSNGTIGQGKNEYLTANDPVIGSYRDPSQRYDSDETVRYYQNKLCIQVVLIRMS